MIIVKLMGGLGNQMFQYAAARRLAEINQTNMAMDLGFLADRTPRENFVYRDYQLNLFNIEENIADPDVSAFFSGKQTGIFQTCRARVKSSYLIGRPAHIEEPHFHFFPELLNAPKNAYLDGYWQSEKYFKDIEPIVRKEFTFKNPLHERCKELAQSIQSGNSVCINVRRGDFITNPTHGTMSNQYYQDGIDTLTDKISSPAIFIFSDDVLWCKQNMQFNHPIFFVDHDYAGEKFEDYLQLMTLCKYFVIANSTFSWWAAWLCSFPEKIIVAPKQWFQADQHDTRDVIPAEWIRL
jgi:hypothetical protein